jgi:hypothetical protein
MLRIHFEPLSIDPEPKLVRMICIRQPLIIVSGRQPGAKISEFLPKKSLVAGPDKSRIFDRYIFKNSLVHEEGSVPPWDRDHFAPTGWSVENAVSGDKHSEAGRIDAVIC